MFLHKAKSPKATDLIQATVFEAPIHDAARSDRGTDVTEAAVSLAFLSSVFLAAP